MDAFLTKAQNIHTIEDAQMLLWEELANPSALTYDALELSINAHDGQTRKSGEPYVVHPILVAAITASFTNDEAMVQASLLHDVVEDTSYTIEELESLFGKDVAHIVEGLTKIVEIRDEELISSNSNERLINSALTFRKMLIASIEDIRVLVIKLCDRLHNMLTLDALSVEKQKRIAEETLVVYAPIAHRLGISILKNELEDLSFFYIYPKEYIKIDDYMTSNTQNLQVKLNTFIQDIKELMHKYGFVDEEFDIFGRVKHYYSIYMKMQRKGVSIDEILDLLAVRIIVKKPIDCYKVLGLIHLSYTPLVSRLKDYVSIPKDNGYQTLHTTLFSDEGIIEAQIRTVEMDRLSEYGVAAHWKYKEGSTDDVKLGWLEGLHYKHESIEEFYTLAKGDLFSEEISVFSPKGDSYTLPKGAIALDFAYAIHSEVGANAKSALINKNLVPLLTVLKNGDMVNVIRGEEPHLHCSWIKAVKTSKAQDGIKSICRARIKESNTLSAYNILSTVFNQPTMRIKILLNEIELQDSISRVATQIEYYNEAISKVAGHIGAKKVHFWELLKRKYKKPKIKEIEHFNLYTNKPLDGVEFDYCCHPKVGDEIVSFYRDSKAIIHHKLCRKAKIKMLDNNQMIFIEWSEDRLYKYRLLISLQNKKGTLAALLTRLNTLNLNVLSIQLGIKNSDSAEYCQIDVESHEAKKSKLFDKISQKYKLIEIISLDDAYNQE